MRYIGFSQGDLYKILDVFSEENINLLKDCGSNAIEINCHSIADIPKLDSVLRFLNGFKRVSLHLPCDIRYGNDEQTKQVLSSLYDFYKKANIELAVVHPDLIENFEVFSSFPMNWAIENMDSRKKSFQDVSDLKLFFAEHPSWDLVLDLGHCNDNDKTMKLADDLIFSFKDRIKEIHLSGYETFHDPLHLTKQVEIIKYCKKLDAPIIIESVLETKDAVEKEFDYVIENLK